MRTAGPRHGAAPVSLAVAVSLAATTLGGCGGGGGADPRALVREAQRTLDAASALHFTLTSADTPDSGTVLTGGSGDVARPNGFRGTLKVNRSGLGLSIDVISVGGTVYLKLPFAPGYSKADPSTYGFSDPGRLLDPTSGLTKLLSAAADMKSAGKDRLGGETLDEVDVTLPGTVVDQVLADADPTKPVHGRLGIDPGSHELRRAVLTGPLLDADVNTTFTVVLDHYGEHVSISAP